MPNTFDDGVDEFTRADRDPEADQPMLATVLCSIAAFAACATFVFTVFKIGRDALRHTPEYQLTHMPLVMAFDVVITLFTMFVLAKSQAMEGTAARGMALAAVAISFLASTVAGYSWYQFVTLVRASHGVG